MTGVEKNVNAVNTLRNMVLSEDMKNVTILSGDMRNVQKKGSYGASHPADIVVSELLGSFSDNQLSPECLYPTERFGHSGTIYIPGYYRSLFRPMSSQILWESVEKIKYPPNENPFEKGYDTCIHSASYPCGDEIATVFEFWHPSEDKDSKRDAEATFRA